MMEYECQFEFPAVAGQSCTRLPYDFINMSVKEPYDRVPSRGIQNYLEANSTSWESRAIGG